MAGARHGVAGRVAVALGCRAARLDRAGAAAALLARDPRRRLAAVVRRGPDAGVDRRDGEDRDCAAAGAVRDARPGLRGVPAGRVSGNRFRAPQARRRLRRPRVRRADGRARVAAASRHRARQLGGRGKHAARQPTAATACVAVRLRRRERARLRVRGDGRGLAGCGCRAAHGGAAPRRGRGRAGRARARVRHAAPCARRSRPGRGRRDRHGCDLRRIGDADRRGARAYARSLARRHARGGERRRQARCVDRGRGAGHARRRRHIRDARAPGGAARPRARRRGVHRSEEHGPAALREQVPLAAARRRDRPHVLQAPPRAGRARGRRTRCAADRGLRARPPGRRALLRLRLPGVRARARAGGRRPGRSTLLRLARDRSDPHADGGVARDRARRVDRAFHALRVERGDRSDRTHARAALELRRRLARDAGAVA